MNGSRKFNNQILTLPLSLHITLEDSFNEEVNLRRRRSFFQTQKLGESFFCCEGGELLLHHSALCTATTYINNNNNSVCVCVCREEKKRISECAYVMRIHNFYIIHKHKIIFIFSLSFFFFLFTLARHSLICFFFRKFLAKVRENMEKA